MRPYDVLRIGELFQRLGWPTDQDATDITRPIPDLFDRFCRMCARLDGDQRDLILKLTEDYRWIYDANVLRTSLIQQWHRLALTLQKPIKTIAVLPLIKPHSRRAKSADAACVWLRGYHVQLIKLAQQRDVVFCDSPPDFRKNYAGPSTALVLADDYIGSGATARKAIKAILGTSKRTRQGPLGIIAVAAHQGGINVANKLGFDVFAQHTFLRGITDHPQLSANDDARKTMMAIGASLGIPKKDRMGYEKVEALLTLLRTPNDTFPVYWTNRKVKGSVWSAPFPRFRK